MMTTLYVIALSQAVSMTPAVARETVEGPVVMTSAEIKAYNASLTRDDPAYIRCVRTLETGSLVKKVTSCRTNAEWSRVNEVGNQDARDTVEYVQSHQSNRDVVQAPVGPLIGN